MSKKIILIALDWIRPKDPPLSLGHSSIVATLRSAGVTCVEKSWAVNASDFNNELVLIFIEENVKTFRKDTEPDDIFIGFGVYVWNDSQIKNILLLLKKRNIAGKIILGGPQISYIGAELTEDIEDYGTLEIFYPLADIFIRGYAEQALLALLSSSLTKPQIDGIHFSKTIDSGRASKIDLAYLPSPILSGLIKPQRFLRLETKRGCIFNCAFCQHKSMEPRKIYEFPFERIQKEIKWIAQHPEIIDLAIIDPTFNIPKTNYLLVIDEFINSKYCGKLSLQCRLEFITDELLNRIERLNTTAEVTLEFGLQTTNYEEAEIIKRENNLLLVSKNLRECLIKKIAIEVSLIYGLPLQTVKSFVESIQFLMRLGVPIIKAWPLMLLRGTELYENREKYGLVESKEKTPHVIESNSFTQIQYQKMQLIASLLDVYNHAYAEDKQYWEISALSDEIDPESFTVFSFFGRHKYLISDEALKDKHNDCSLLQHLYDGCFGLTLK